MFGRSLPSWLVNPGVVLLRKHNRNKDEPLCEEVELLHANPSYAFVRFRDGRETTVSTTDLAPQGASSQNEETEVHHSQNEETEVHPASSTVEHPGATEIETSPETFETEPAALRRLTRRCNAVDGYGMVPYM